MRPFNCRLLCGLSVGLSLLSGCGSGGSPRANVSGKISYNGQPLTAGTVTFVSDKAVVTGQIRNGEYTVLQAPVGPVKIGVMTPAPPSAMQMNQKVDGKTFSGEAANVVTIPGNFNNPDFSGLTYSVSKESPQTHDLILP